MRRQIGRCTIVQRLFYRLLTQIFYNSWILLLPFTIRLFMAVLLVLYKDMLSDPLRNEI
jgi:hypothetical protein